MPDKDTSSVSNSFSIFIRGVVIGSGGQRIHCSKLLMKQLEIWEESGTLFTNMEPYINSLKYGVAPHGGFEIKLELLLQQLMNIDGWMSCSLFPRGHNRLTP